jgi:hypothetical protein
LYEVLKPGTIEAAKEEVAKEEVAKKKITQEDAIDVTHPIGERCLKTSSKSTTSILQKHW